MLLNLRNICLRDEENNTTRDYHSTCENMTPPRRAVRGLQVTGDLGSNALLEESIVSDGEDALADSVGGVKGEDNYY